MRGQSFTSKLLERLTPESLRSKDEREIYQYGLISLIGGSCNFTLSLLLSIPLHRVLETLLFLVAFLLLRRATSGFHLESSLACLVGSQLLCLAAVNLLTPCLARAPVWLLLLLAGGAGAVVFLWAPIRHVNLDLRAEESRALHGRSVLVYCLECVGSLLLYILLENKEKASAVLAAILCTVALMLAAKWTHQEVTI